MSSQERWIQNSGFAVPISLSFAIARLGANLGPPCADYRKMRAGSHVPKVTTQVSQKASALHVGRLVAHRALLYKSNPMLRAVLCLLLLTTSFVSAAPCGPETASSFQDRVATLQKKEGFFPYYWDAKKGALLFELSPAMREREFLYVTALGSGIGSI